MTNNTIPNVPRQLLERAATSIEQRMCIQCEGVPCCMPESLNTLSGCLHPGVPPADVIDWARVSEIGNQIYRREGKTHG